MHLLVLGAFWPALMIPTIHWSCLNAPSGAGCFLAAMNSTDIQVNLSVLMHLLVLGAF